MRRQAFSAALFLSFGVAATALPMTVSAASPAGAAAKNPIAVENQRPGTTAWRITRVARDSAGQIKGYASATSVDKGQRIVLYVSVAPAQTYTADVYRIGWYQGTGGRLMQHVGPLHGVRQPTCPRDASTGMISCNWAPAYTLKTRSAWTSGVYLVLLRNAQGFENYIEFVLRDDAGKAKLLYQQPVATYEAYNDYPNDHATGKSLYEFNSFGPKTVTGTTRAAKVSFDRPYADDGTGAAGQSFLNWEVNFIRWLEKSGYDVSYSTDVDTHAGGGRLLRHAAFLSVGHDEYWSKGMFDAVEDARDAGVNLGFFGSNGIAWQVRFEPSARGVPNRVIVCYKDAAIDPTTDPALETVNWRVSPGPNRPEQGLMGVQFTSVVKDHRYVPYVITSSGNWVFARTGLKNGDKVRGIVGYEADRLFSQYPPPDSVPGTYALLSHSPFVDEDTNAADYDNSSIYQAKSGAWVFAAGTMAWGWALDDFGGHHAVDPRIQKMTTNILNRFEHRSG